MELIIGYESFTKRIYRFESSALNFDWLCRSIRCRSSSAQNESEKILLMNKNIIVSLNSKMKLFLENPRRVLENG